VFHTSYVEARCAFRDVARETGFELASYELPDHRGVDKEALTIDVGTKGSGNQLILTSGIHGVEGYAGSACQLDCMKELKFDGVHLVLIHGVNPYGFSHKSRTNECRVDINRNFGRDFPREHNIEYGAIHAKLSEFIHSPSLPDLAEIRHRLKILEREFGTSTFAAAVAGGQYCYPDGLFYGGEAPQASLRLLNDIISNHCSDKGTRTLTIDFHTGLGPSGHGELIYLGDHQDPAFEFAKRWLNGVTCPAAGDSASQAVKGSAENFFIRGDLGDQVSHVALEFGTAPLLDVLAALCCDAWLRNHSDVNVDTANIARQIVFNAFCSTRTTWQDAVLSRARQVVAEAIRAVRS